MKCDELIEFWLEYVQKNCSRHHKKAVRGVAKNYFKPLRKLPYDSVTREIIRDLYEKGKWGSPNTANRNLMLLKSMFNLAIKEGLIPYNPIDKMPMFRQPRTYKYVPSQEDVEKIAKELPPNLRDIYDGYRYTGAREAELRNLKWVDVKFDQNEIILYTRKKRDRNWTAQPVTIVPELMEILRRREGGTIYVFGEPEKMPPQKLGYWIKKVCRRKGIKPFTTHALRHYAAHTMAERGAPTELVQRVLRHEDIKTTQKYLNGLRTAHEAAKYLSDTIYSTSANNS